MGCVYQKVWSHLLLSPRLRVDARVELVAPPLPTLLAVAPGDELGDLRPLYLGRRWWWWWWSVVEGIANIVLQQKRSCGCRRAGASAGGTNARVASADASAVGEVGGGVATVASGEGEVEGEDEGEAEAEAEVEGEVYLSV